MRILGFICLISAVIFFVIGIIDYCRSKDAASTRQAGFILTVFILCFVSVICFSKAERDPPHSWYDENGNFKTEEAVGTIDWYEHNVLGK